MTQVGLVQTVADELARSGLDLRGVGLGWARAAPAIVLIPAFGLRALPSTARIWFALLLGVTIAPSMRAQVGASTPWALALIESSLRGLPVAVSAAVPLWAATMTGGVIDTLRGSPHPASVSVVESDATTLGVLFSLLASVVFLATGGPYRVAMGLLAGADPTISTAMRVAVDLSAGIQIAVAVAGPVLAASMVVEVANGLLARAASPAQIFLLLNPLRSFAILAVAALTMERMVRALAMLVRERPLP